MTNDKLQTAVSKYRSALVIYLLLICSFALRLAPLGRYVTPDEPAWVYRSIRFSDALSARDWTAIPSTGHPGVTTMWLGAAGVAVQRWLAPIQSAAHLDWIRRLAWLAPENGQAFRRLAVFLPWGRVAVALATTLGLAALYLLLARLFRRRVALLTIGLLSFDPFLTGHSGLLHTDALLATFCLLALAAALNGMQEQRASWWIYSGLFTGLALLTKTPAIILPPFILLLCAISATRNSQFTIRNSLLFILVTIVTIFALYPALWASTTDTIRTLSTFAGKHVGMAQRPIFFAGQTTYDPGLAFYPVVLLFRVSPLVLIGLIISIITLRRLPADHRLACLLLLAFAIGFGALMSLGAKKHDRYLLPALPPLALVAALGWEYVSGQGASRQGASRQVILVLIQLGLTLPFTFYPLTSFNFLAGGPWIAARVLSTDWGEGMGAAARWLNQRPDADQLTVAALSVPTFASIFDGYTIPLDQTTQADYIAHSPGPMHPYPTAHTTHLGFLDHAVVLTNTAPFEQAAYLAAHANQDDLILLDAHTPLPRTYTGPGTLASLTDLPDRAAIAARLAELCARHSKLWLVADPAALPITAAHLRQTLDTIATPVSTATVASTTITQYENPTTKYTTHNTKYANFRQITLIDALLPDTPVNTPFPIFLRWQTLAPTPTDLHASLHLRDADGHLWAQVGQPVLNDVTFPTSAWTPGEWNDDTLTLKPPDHIPPDTYVLELTITDNQGAQLGAWDAHGQFQGVRVSLGNIRIAPPAEPAQQQHLAPQSLCKDAPLLIAGPLQTCAPKPPPDWNNPTHTIPSGDTLTLALTWSATAPPSPPSQGESGGGDYRVRWRLLDADHSTALEQIVAISPYPTSHWRAGDSFESRYDLRLDPALPATRYTLALNVLAPDGHPLWAEDETLAVVEILPRDRSFELPDDIAHPLHLALGDAVHLRGFDLDRTQAAPGDDLSLTLYWQAGGPTDLDYTVFVHLVGPDEQPHGQTDQFPGAGAAPTTSWALGQAIVDKITLPVDADAPAGPYHIAVGLYDASSGGRMPIRDDSGNPLPNDQIILPLEITIAGDPQ